MFGYSCIGTGIDKLLLISWVKTVVVQMTLFRVEYGLVLSYGKKMRVEKIQIYLSQK